MAVRKKTEKDLPDRWFLEVRGQISGPFGSVKILDRLLKDEIVIMHRVSRDRRNWAAICNTPFFEEMINRQIRIYSGESGHVGQMRAGDDEEEFEISEVFGLHGATEGISEQLEHAKQLEELTANIQRLNNLRKEILENRKTVFIEKETTIDEVHPDDQDVFVAVAPKKMKWRELFNTDDPVNKRRMYLALGVLIVGIACSQAYVYIANYNDTTEDKAKLKAAIEAQAAGDYAKAMAAFKGIKGSSLAHADFASAQNLLDIADAHIAGKDAKTGQELLTRAFAMKLTPTEAARAHALQSLIAAQAGDLDRAARELETSLKKSEIYSTLHNLSILKIKTKKFAEAEPLLLKALQVAGRTPGLDTGATVLALFETANELDRNMLEDFLKKPVEGAIEPPKMRRLEAVAELLEMHIKNTSLKQKLYMALAVTRENLGQHEAFQLAAYEFIDSVPPEEEPHLNREIDQDLAEWSHLVTYCSEIYKKPKSGHFGAAFYGSCLWRSHGAAQAIPFARYALSLAPRDALFTGLTASLLIAQKKPDEAKQILIVDGKPIIGSKLATSAFASLGIDPSLVSGVAPTH